MEALKQMTYEIIGAAFNVHAELDPGLDEPTYEICLEYEWMKRDLRVAPQKSLPAIYDGIKLDAGYRIDLLGEGCIIVDLKAVAVTKPIQKTQLITYLKSSESKDGILININVSKMKKDAKRIMI